ncbi:MAG: signal peptidase I [Paracoccaceae bacterium]
MLFFRSLSRSFDWSGTAPRREFALYLVALAAIIGACFYASLSLEPGPVRRWALPIAACAILTPGWWAVSARRMHDIGRSSWWLLLAAVPVVNILLIAALLFAASGRGPSGRFIGRPGHALAALASLALALLLASRILWQPFYTPAGSMKPTLLVNDFVLVSKPFGFAPGRGDVIAFRNTVDGLDYIKRVVGLPGDTVQMLDGRLSLNGAPVALEPAGAFEEIYEPQGPARLPPNCGNAPVGLGGVCRSNRLTETLPGAAPHDVLDIGASALDDTPVYTVPPGQYFVLGDNRDNSKDSRTPVSAAGIGFVPADMVIGRAARVLFSSAGPSLLTVWTWRPGRFLKAIR